MNNALNIHRYPDHRYPHFWPIYYVELYGLTHVRTGIHSISSLYISILLFRVNFPIAHWYAYNYSSYVPYSKSSVISCMQYVLLHRLCGKASDFHINSDFHIKCVTFPPMTWTVTDCRDGAFLEPLIISQATELCHAHTPDHRPNVFRLYFIL